MVYTFQATTFCPSGVYYVTYVTMRALVRLWGIKHGSLNSTCLLYVTWLQASRIPVASREPLKTGEGGFSDLNCMSLRRR